MSTNPITSFSGLWKPTEYRNIEAGKVSIGPNQATCHLPDDYGRPTGTRKALADEFYYLDPYSGGGSGPIHACRTGCKAGGSMESLQYSTQRTSQPSQQPTGLL